MELLLWNYYLVTSRVILELIQARSRSHQDQMSNGVFSIASSGLKYILRASQTSKCVIRGTTFAAILVFQHLTKTTVRLIHLFFCNCSSMSDLWWIWSTSHKNWQEHTNQREASPLSGTIYTQILSIPASPAYCHVFGSWKENLEPV